jgi:hypothetical protein
MSQPGQTLQRATILNQLNLPTYTSTANAPAGDAALIEIDGSGSEDQGVYAWTGNGYEGPVHVDTDTDTDTNTQNPGDIDLRPQDVIAISSPTNGMARWHDGTGQLPPGIAQYKLGTWWVDGCVAKWDSVSATMSDGEYIFDTEVASTSAAFEVGLGDTGSASVSATKMVNDSADSTHRIKFIESETSISNPSITFTVRQVSP